MTTTAVEIQSQPGRAGLDQIGFALSPGRMGALIEQVVAGQPGAVSGARGLHPEACRILDMKYEPGDYAIILYELGSQMVAGYLQWKESRAAPPLTGYAIPSIGMQLYPFPLDPWLTGLERALDPQAVAQAAGQALPECRSGQAQVVRVKTSLQRYRPGKRLTVRLQVTLRDALTRELSQRTYYGKVYHKPEKARAVYDEMQQLSEIAAARDGRATLARPEAFLPELSMILQAPVGGIPLDSLVGPAQGRAAACDPRGWVGTQRAAAALAAVHTSGMVSPRQRPITQELARFQKRAAQVEAVDPELGRRLGELAAALPAWVDQLEGWGAELCLIHGDCKPSQFLIGSERVAILDFDHCGMADPANDVGTFLATLRQLAARGSLVAHQNAAHQNAAHRNAARRNAAHQAAARQQARAQAHSAWLLALEKQFLEDYCQASQRPDSFRQRATWYEAVGLMRKALRGFGRSPFSPLPGLLAAEGWRCLADLPPAGQAVQPAI